MLLDAKGEPLPQHGIDLSPGAINAAVSAPELRAERRVSELRRSVLGDPETRIEWRCGLAVSDEQLRAARMLSAMIDPPMPMPARTR